MLRRVGFALCLIIASPSPFAHTELPHPVWCAGGTMHQVGSFDFGQEAIAHTLETLCPTVDNGDGRQRNCGQFDDDYKRSYDASQLYCHTFSRPWLMGEIPDAGSVIVVVTDPETFLVSTHHDDYFVTQGLKGVCLRCEGRLSPVAPLRNRGSGD